MLHCMGQPAAYLPANRAAPPPAPSCPTPQYAFIGISELLAVAGSLELFYQQAPDAMRSLCAALQVVTMGIGSWLAAGVVAAVQARRARGRQGTGASSGGRPAPVCPALCRR